MTEHITEANIMTLMMKETDSLNTDDTVSNASTVSHYALLSFESSDQYLHDYASALDRFDVAIVRCIPYFGYENLTDLTVISPTIKIMKYMPPRLESLTLVKTLFDPIALGEVYTHIINISIMVVPYFDFSIFPNATIIRAIAVDTVVFAELHPEVNYLKLIVGCNIDLNPFINVSHIVISALYKNIFVYNASLVDAEIINGLSVIFDNEYITYYFEKKKFLSDDDEFMDDWGEHQLTNYRADVSIDYDKSNNNIGDLFYFLLANHKYTIDYSRLLDENNDEDDVNKTLADFII